LTRPHHSPSSIALAYECEYAWGIRYIEGAPRLDTPWAEFEACVKLPWKRIFAGEFPWWTPAQKGKPGSDDMGVILAKHFGRTVLRKEWSASLGKGMHAVLEGYYGQGPAPDWDSLPGQIALSGLHLLPRPEECIEIRIENGLTLEESVPLAPDACEACAGQGRVGAIGRRKKCHACKGAGAVPVFGGRAFGVTWKGFIDLRARISKAGLKRLALWKRGVRPSDWVTFDYKSTAGEGYVKDTRATAAAFAATGRKRWHEPEILEDDGQVNLYAYDALCQRVGAGGERPIFMRWVYFCTRGKRNAWARAMALTPAEVTAKVQAMAARAAELDTLETLDECIRNPESCDNFAGCEHHVSRGGRCDAHRSLGLACASIAKRRLPIIMAKPKPTSPDDYMAKLEALNAKAGGKKAPPPPVEEDEEEDEEEEDEPAPAPKKGKKAPPPVEDEDEDEDEDEEEEDEDEDEDEEPAPKAKKAAPPGPTRPQARPAPDAPAAKAPKAAAAAPSSAVTFRLTVESNDPNAIAAIAASLGS
jgi:hypothetical protein